MRANKDPLFMYFHLLQCSIKTYPSHVIFPRKILIVVWEWKYRSYSLISETCVKAHHHLNNLVWSHKKVQLIRIYKNNKDSAPLVLGPITSMENKLTGKLYKRNAKWGRVNQDKQSHSGIRQKKKIQPLFHLCVLVTMSHCLVMTGPHNIQSGGNSKYWLTRFYSTSTSQDLGGATQCITACLDHHPDKESAQAETGEKAEMG